MPINYLSYHVFFAHLKNSENEKYIYKEESKISLTPTSGDSQSPLWYASHRIIFMHIY